jgi:hypothetical protein
MSSFITPCTALRACVLIYAQSRPGCWVSLRSLVAAMGVPEARIRNVAQQLVDSGELRAQSFNGLDGWFAQGHIPAPDDTRVVISRAALAAMYAPPAPAARFTALVPLSPLSNRNLEIAP